MSSIVLKLPENIEIGDMLRTDETAITVEVNTTAVIINGITFNPATDIKVGWADPPVSTLPKNVDVDDEFRWVRPVIQYRRYKDANGDLQYDINGKGPFDPTVQVKTLVEDDGTEA